MISRMPYKIRPKYNFRQSDNALWDSYDRKGSRLAMQESISNWTYLVFMAGGWMF